MASSLRSRLWLSYALLIGVALTIVAIGLVVALQRSPVLYRQTIKRIYLAGSAVSVHLDEMFRPTPANIERYLQQQSAARQLRLAILRRDGNVEMDFHPDSATPPMPGFSLPLVATEDDTNFADTFRDSRGVEWLYTLHNLQDARFLLVAAPRPTLRTSEIFRNDVLGPFLQAALVALLMAELLSLFIGQWISNPLKRMASSASRLDFGEDHPLPLEGPREVQQLGEALNEMAHQVKNSQLSQREFVANVSHELKTPLTSIQGFAQAILDGTVQSKEALRQSAEIIFSESSRMARLVTDLLSLARLEAGTADLQSQPVELAGLLKGVVDQFSLQALQANITLETDLAGPLPTIGDADHLAQVFTNLVDNAIKFTPAGGKITIRAGALNGSVVASVIDSGVGIAPEDATRIFERFYQVDRSRRGGAGRGVGLGLAIAAQIVAAHGGRIWMDSRPGEGATFTVSLPMVNMDESGNHPRVV